MNKNDKIFFLWLNFFFALPLLNAQGSWTQKTDFGGGLRTSAVGFSIGNKGYIGIGHNHTSVIYQDFWEWDQATDSWTQKANFPGADRSLAVGFSIGTKGYVATGAGSSVNYQDFWEWDQATNIWTQRANFPGMARNCAVGFSIDSKGYVGTGTTSFNNQQLLNDFWEWDQGSDTWTQKTNFPGTPRSDATGFSIGGKGYIGLGVDILGESSHWCTNDFWEWDQATNTWVQKANFPGSAKELAASFSIGKTGYIGTGCNCPQKYSCINSLWAWNQNSNTWTQKSNYSGTGFSGLIGFSIGNKGYMGTGSNYAGSEKDFWEFTPDSISTSIEQEELTREIRIYPNPANGKFTMSSSKEITQVTIYNSWGMIVHAVNHSFMQLVLDLSNQPKGIYFVVMDLGSERRTKKMVLE